MSKNNRKKRAKSQRVLGLVGLSVLGVVSATAQAGSFEFGSGNMQLQGGFLGLKTEISGPVTTYTIRENHDQILDSNWFYSYYLTNYSGQSMEAVGADIVSVGGGLIESPLTDYEVVSIDGQVGFGYDFYSKGESEYIGMGVVLGIATPYIKNSGSGDSSSSAVEESSESNPTIIQAGTSQAVDFLASTTEFMGYNVGLKFAASKALGPYASVYGDISYAWQTMSVKNKTLNLNTSVEGYYMNYNMGVRYTPLKTKVDLSFITLDPSLYFTFGVNQAELLLKDLNIDISGQNFVLESSSLKSSTTSLYLGVGYAF
jgi:hypothetical protein